MRWTAAVLFLAMCGLSAAAPLPTPEALMQKVNDRDRTLRTVHCKVEAGLHLSVLPLTLDGDLYYERPNQVRLVFEDMPDVVQSQRRVFSSVVPHSKHLDQYKVVVEGESTLDGHATWTLSVTPLDAADNVKSGRLWLRQDDLTVPRLILNYVDGSSVSADIDYVSVKSYRLPSHLEVKFKLPHLSARAQADFDHYEVNEKLPPHVFDKKP